MNKLFELGKGAEFSQCGKHRKRLWRIWDNSLPLAMCIGLNPSTANETKNDPTIRLTEKMLKSLGYGGFYMTNLFTIISSDPKILREKNEWGEWLRDRDILVETAKICRDVIVAWGNCKQAEARASECLRQFPDAKCFGTNKNGTPFHPMAMMYKGITNSPTLIKYQCAKP